MKRTILAAAAMAALALGAAQATPSFTVLHSFDHQNDFATGFSPYTLTWDAPRNRLYATLLHGGNSHCDNGCGTIVAVDPAGKTAKVVHAFDTQRGEGTPAMSLQPLFLDGDGTLYGTTSLVYALTQGDRGTWHFGVVHDPGNGDLSSPPLADPATGVLYGLACSSGAHHEGQLYSLTPNADKTAWTYAALFDFTGGANGACPNASLTMDGAGHLYGIASDEGDFDCQPGGCGVVFQLFQANGVWHEHVLHVFTGLNGDGRAPVGGVVLDAKGNLYGATLAGGTYDQRCFNGCGTAYELVKRDKWAMTVLHQFDFDNGSAPHGGPLAIDAKGNLFGTTAQGGLGGAGLPGYGTVFELKHKKSGFQFGVLHFFCAGGGCADGSEPLGAVSLDAAGTLYGITNTGGAAGDGTVFKLKP
ncbi:MAG: hypothetical protein JOZ72_11925 [Alphaproteobacteria bacterium]|nr:hypothetical protein [Alphaproteobacteria bacterium]